MPFDCRFFAGAGLLCTEPLTFEAVVRVDALVGGRTCFAAMASTFSAALCATTVLMGWVIKLFVLVKGSFARTAWAGLVLSCCDDGLKEVAFGCDDFVDGEASFFGEGETSVAFAENLMLCGDF